MKKTFSLFLLLILYSSWSMCSAQTVSTAASVVNKSTTLATPCAPYSFRTHSTGIVQCNSGGNAWVVLAAAGSGVSSITGTANQVNVSAATGAVTLSLPQSIATGSSPTFSALTITNAFFAQNGQVRSTTNNSIGAMAFYDSGNTQQYYLLNAGDTRFWTTTSAGISIGTNSVERVLINSSAAAFTVPVTSTGLTVGSGGTALTKILKSTVTIDPSSIAANTVSSQTFTLTGAATSDSLVLNPPTAGLTSGLVVMQCYVSATNQITLVLWNSTGSSIDEPSGSWVYKIVR